MSCAPPASRVPGSQLEDVHGEQRRVSEDALRHREWLDAQVSAAVKREAAATSSCASRVAELTTAQVARELASSGDPAAAAAGVDGDADASLALAYKEMQEEMHMLKAEEEARVVRPAGRRAACGTRAGAPRVCVRGRAHARHARTRARVRAVTRAEEHRTA